MTTKELIKAEIDRMGDEYLDELYQLVRCFTEVERPKAKLGLMERLKQIQINAPEDFTANLDLYINGEKRVESDLH